MGRDSSVGIATSYMLDGPGIESRCGRNFPYLSRLALGPTQPPKQWAPGLSRGGKPLERDVNNRPNLAPRLKEAYSYTSAPLWAFAALSRATFTFTYSFQSKYNYLRAAPTATCFGDCKYFHSILQTAWWWLLYIAAICTYLYCI